MQPINSFPPVEPQQAKILILGSMPGKASLAVQGYYAHPRNAFWPILAELLGFSRDLDYASRLEVLKKNGIGLWDVMASCIRATSLDADIVETSIQANDFSGWFQRHPQTQAVFCNGGKAYQSYQRRVLPHLPETYRQCPLVQLPSTSPAHASLKFDAKLAAWRQLLDFL
ncbi:DNA-deoxyinosine glycosylase [Marinospirillum perlucidum]|uniref:DNA-deoxyinosine glycosylase n=1 Tax=Marinospirillum perlucidum TaxID=1982602 RepID=UPI000DF213D7|nr:DNA-deoxyinosine glycosylase [Marinospirillum perlucidum]